MKKYCVNDIFFGQNEIRYKIDNFIYRTQNKSQIIKNNNNENELIISIPLINKCFISKMFYIKKEKRNGFNNELKIINESQNKYISSTSKKFLKEINNIINKEIKQIKKEKNISNIDKIEKTNFI